MKNAHKTPPMYKEGALAASKRHHKSTNPYGMACLQKRGWWFAGYHDYQLGNIDKFGNDLPKF